MLDGWTPLNVENISIKKYLSYVELCRPLILERVQTHGHLTYPLF